ncbi:MAG: hypothetical protein JWL59_4810 [Chthoniobacteraceae bacterium]|nr:hypothetical protein [Chthoniobacteraceae bacterium]
MKRIELSSLGLPISSNALVTWEELEVGEPWASLIGILAPGSVPSEIQARAIREGNLLSSRRNLIVSGPTNSGKSLLAYMGLLLGARAGRRVLLLEPLRAIAQEKFDELELVTTQLSEKLGRKIGVEITTGDYRLKEETMQSPPPETGEIVIATPERIEAILRNPDNDSWIQSFVVVCVDEAHLLGDGHRGASLEYVITSFQTQSAPPRMFLLSATLGDTSAIQRWLEPCDVVMSMIRRPPLDRSIQVLEPGDEPKQSLRTMVQTILAEPGHSLIIFVYQKAWAVSLAADLTLTLGAVCGSDGTRPYHSSLSSATKAEIRHQFLAGSCRCIVTTAALALGVNLPATHVIVRDLQYGPGNPIPVGSLFQMAGRAGRGTLPGQAIFLWKDGDAWALNEMHRELESPNIAEIRSVLISKRLAATEPPLAETLLTLLARRPETGMSQIELERFLSATLAGEACLEAVTDSLAWLGANSRVFAHVEEETWKATRLGQAAIRASMPLGLAAGFAQLVRDLLSVDPTDVILHEWTTLDMLIIVELMATRSGPRKSFGEPLAVQVDSALEQSLVKSVLFRNWIRGAKNYSKAEEIMGSLGFVSEGGAEARTGKARQIGYLATWRALVLWHRANGGRVDDVERRWKVKDLAELEESWRDDRLFILGAMVGLWDLRCFFFHLKEECCADSQRIQRVKRIFQRLRLVNLQVMDLVSWCSPLGPVFLRLRRSVGNNGRQIPAKATMRKLEEAGVTSASELASKTQADLTGLGVRKDLAASIVAFMRRR